LYADSTNCVRSCWIWAAAMSATACSPLTVGR
jgi:hypothetical protein